MLPYVLGRLIVLAGCRAGAAWDQDNPVVPETSEDVRDLLSLCGVSEVPCSCEQSHIGTTKRNVHARVDEHSRYSRLSQQEKSTVVEHALAIAAVSYTHLDVYKRQVGHLVKHINTKVL